MITINKNKTLTFSHAQKGRSCLLELSQERGVGLVNQLCALELVAAHALARNGRTAFPLGAGGEIYEALHARLEVEAVERAQARLDGTPLPGSALTWKLIEDSDVGELRKVIVDDIGSSFNGPLDSYLEIAVNAKRARATGEVTV